MLSSWFRLKDTLPQWHPDLRRVGWAALDKHGKYFGGLLFACFH